MSCLRPILADQLSLDLSALSDIKPHQDIVVMCEVRTETDYVPHHPQKIILLFSAMRHFAQELQTLGLKVHYVYLDDRHNTQNLMTEWERIAELYQCEQVMLTKPGEWRLINEIEHWQKQTTLAVSMREDNRFLCAEDLFKQWADGRKQLRMEYFYQMMRQKYKLLMDETQKPVGGRWNYDSENREGFKGPLNPAPRLDFVHDDITKAVIAMVKTQFSSHFGDPDRFNYAVQRADALSCFEDFIDKHLPYFGQHQDVMQGAGVFLHHSVISMYLNIGLLEPLFVCQKAEAAFYSGHAPLFAVEGFIRQVLGWREYVRGIYFLKMPGYQDLNYFEATNPLPALYWGQATQMNCLKEVVGMTQAYAYSHHIQRLMITGNFALLAGIAPKEVCAWYLAVYLDAFEWVELPNTLGMALFADGGIMASKPYAASARYINKMSNFCDSCAFKPKELLGEKACPFNSLYWHFIAKHEATLQKNPRMAYMIASWRRFPDAKKDAILAKATHYLTCLSENNL
jgi:deoxyribodipyrimidine photolyase-related protein